MSTPLVSVVIPVHNGGATIGEQLESLASQTHAPPFEVIVSLDRCTDQTLDTVRAFEGHLPIRTVDVRGPAGAAAARNAGVRTASADQIVHCDHDDVVHTRWVRTMHDALQQHDVIVGSSRDLPGTSPLAGAEKVYEPDRPPSLFSMEIVSVGNNMGYRRTVFEAVGGFNVEFDRGQDVAFGLQAQLLGFRLVFVPDAIVYIRARSSVRQMWLQRYRWGIWHARLMERYLPDDRRPIAREVAAGIRASTKSLSCVRATPMLTLTTAAERLGRVHGALDLARRGRWPLRSSPVADQKATRLIALPADAPVLGGLLVRVPADRHRSEWRRQALEASAVGHRGGSIVVDETDGVGLRAITAALANGPDAAIVVVCAEGRFRRCLEENISRAGVAEQIKIVSTHRTAAAPEYGSVRSNAVEPLAAKPDRR